LYFKTHKRADVWKENKNSFIFRIKLKTPLAFDAHEQEKSYQEKKKS